MRDQRRKKMTAIDAERSLIRLGCIPNRGTEHEHGMPSYRVPGDTEEGQAAWYERKIAEYGLVLR